ncbi:unnamed protein product, partial [Ectocarpus sp. 12 AP-2014]
EGNTHQKHGKCLFARGQAGRHEAHQKGEPTVFVMHSDDCYVAQRSHIVVFSAPCAHTSFFPLVSYLNLPYSTTPARRNGAAFATRSPLLQSLLGVGDVGVEFVQAERCFPCYPVAAAQVPLLFIRGPPFSIT